MIDAYLDESGIHDGAEVCMLAGYFGGHGQWKRFDNLWRTILNEFGVPLEECHAKELLTHSGFFHNWDRVRCEEFRQRLAEAVAAYKIHPIVWGIIVKDFYSFTESERKFMTSARVVGGQVVASGSPNRPYYVLFQNVLRQVAGYAPAGGKAHFFFGIDRPFAAYARKIFAEIKSLTGNYRERLGEITFPEAKKTPQLKAADLLAYSDYQWLLKCAKGKIVDLTRPPDLWILHQRFLDKGDMVYLNKQALRETLDTLPFDQRP